MALFQALYDSVDKNLDNRFMVEVHADDLSQVTAKLDEQSPGDRFVLTAIGQRTDKGYEFVYGKRIDGVALATTYAKTKIRFGDDNKIDWPANAKSVEPSLDAISNRYHNSMSAGFILFFGWACVVISCIFTFIIISQDAFQSFWAVSIALSLFITGLFMIFLSWCGGIINDIAISNRYQAELARYTYRNSEN